MSFLAHSPDEPAQNSVEIGFLFGADTIAAHFSVSNFFQVQDIDQLVHGGVSGKI
jgi:hypothetical protein